MSIDRPYIIKGSVAVDDRGIVTFCNDFDMTQVKRFYMLENHRAGFIRAWHGHLTEAKWVTVVSGVAIIGVAKLEKRTGLRPEGLWGIVYKKEEGVYKFVLPANGDVLYIPPGYANGHKNLVEGTRVLHFSNFSLDETQDDDIRSSWEAHRWVWEEQQR